MSLSNSILAYMDCKEFLERALDAERGARIPFRTEKEAEYWRMRCNQFRVLDRRQSKTIFAPGHKMHGHSEYDGLTMTIKYSEDGYHWVYAQKRVIDPGQIEDITDDVPTLQITAEEVRMLENHTDDNETPT